MKKLLQFFACTILLFSIACNGGSAHMGTIQESNILTTQLEEQTLSPDVRAYITLQDSDSIPDNYTKAELYIDDTLIGQFSGGALSYIPEAFGDVSCKIKFTTPSGETEISDTLKLYIETWYFEAKTQENGDAFQPVDNSNVIIFTQPRARGNDDICFMYYLRVPYGKKLKFTPEIVKVTDSRPLYNTVLAVHYRTDEDYSNRADWHPGYEYKYFDTNPETWVNPPKEFESGVHQLYVLPDAKHDLSLMTVYHTGDKTGSFSAYFKSIDYESLGL